MILIRFRERFEKTKRCPERMSWDQDLDEHRFQDSDGHHPLLPFSPSDELLKEGPFPSVAYFDSLK
jgi:hypothetical protein